MKVRHRWILTKTKHLQSLRRCFKTLPLILRGGVLSYLGAIKRERSAISAFKRAAREVIKANQAKYNALRIVMEEYGFLTGKEEIKPPLEHAEAIVTELIMKIVASLDDETYKSIALQLSEGKKNESEV